MSVSLGLPAGRASNHPVRPSYAVERARDRRLSDQLGRQIGGKANSTKRLPEKDRSARHPFR
jgi:hypothetical protein